MNLARINLRTWAAQFTKMRCNVEVVFLSFMPTVAEIKMSISRTNNTIIRRKMNSIWTKITAKIEFIWKQPFFKLIQMILKLGFETAINEFKHFRTKISDHSQWNQSR